MNLKIIKNVLNMAEMRNIMAGSGSGPVIGGGIGKCSSTT
jgi:hypothetical protein